jgi:hypothetical protein
MVVLLAGAVEKQHTSFWLTIVVVLKNWLTGAAASVPIVVPRGAIFGDQTAGACYEGVLRRSGERQGGSEIFRELVLIPAESMPI